MGPQNPIQKETGISYIPTSIKARCGAGDIDIWSLSVDSNADVRTESIPLLTSNRKGICNTPTRGVGPYQRPLPIWFWCLALKVQMSVSFFRGSVLLSQLVGQRWYILTPLRRGEGARWESRTFLSWG